MACPPHRRHRKYLLLGVTEPVVLADLQRIGLRVCSHALCMVSPVFKSAFVDVATNAEQLQGYGLPQRVMSVPDDDGDAMYILCNILHLRNDKLPSQMLPESLCKLAAVVRKYECVVAAGRATLQWFDRLYNSKERGDLWKIIEAAYLLDEAVFFARFTSLWVLQEPLYIKEMPTATDPETQKLGCKYRSFHVQACHILTMV